MAIGTSNSSPFNERYSKYPSEGLGVMFWDNNLGSYPRSGTSIKDLSGNNHNGTLNNFASPPTPTSGYNDGTIFYDGDNDYISFPRDWQTALTEFTYFVIFRRTNAPNAAGGFTTTIVTSEIGEQIKVGNFNQYWSPIINVSGSLGTYTNNCFSGSETNVELDPSSKDFYQIAVCVKPGLIRTYFNGVLNDEQAIDIGPIPDNRLKVSRLSSATIPVSKWEGNIPVFMGYNRCLGQEDITQLYNFFSQVYNNDFFAPVLPQNNLQVMFWDADPASYPRSGNTIYDLSANSYNGTLHNFASPPTPTSGYYNGIIQFDGDNDYISFSRDWLQVTTDFSIFAIFRRTGVPNAAGSYTTSIVTSEIGEQIKVGNYNQYWTPIIEVTSSLGTYYNACSNGSETSVLLDNSSKDFYQIAVCVKAGLARTYVDGVLNDEQVINIGPMTDLRRKPSRLSSANIPASKWEGNIPVFMGYERFLEPEEITQIYTYFDRYYRPETEPQFPLTDLQMMFWDKNKFCYPGTGTVMQDLSGNSNNGTLNNFASPSTPTSGYYNGEIQYDGDNDYINFPNTWLSGKTEFSFHFIIKRGDVPNAHSQTTMSFFGSLPGSYIRLTIYGSGYSFSVFLDGTLNDYFMYSGSGTETSVIIDDFTKYYQFTVCVKGGLVTTYFEGILNDKQTVDIGSLNNPFNFIGRYDVTESWAGNIPVVMGYDKCLEQNEITELHQFFNNYYYK